MLLYGHYQFFPKRVACKRAWCTSCDRGVLAIGTRRILFLHLFFVPLLPVGTATRWICGHCHGDIDARRPVRSSIAGCGVLVGAFFILFAAACIFGALFLPKKDKFDWTDPLPFLILGLAMVSGFWWMRRRARRGYEASARQVEPLPGDVCPLCGQQVLLLGKARCETCDLDIITK
jgi:hypothetical protein